MEEQSTPLAPLDPSEPYALRMTLIRRYWHLNLKFSNPLISGSGKHEVSWVGGNAEADTEDELLALVRTAMGDCGGEGHLWESVGQYEKEDEVFIIQEIVCVDCPAQWRKIPARL